MITEKTVMTPGAISSLSTQVEDIRLYCGVSETKWNHHPVQPGGYACISPVYGRTLTRKCVSRVSVPTDTEVIQDSGAFSDGTEYDRLSFEQALERQIAHAEQYGYAHAITHRASYDWLIDEKWSNGIRHKVRWSEEDAERAVDVTVAAAKYLSKHRTVGCILSAQAVSARQYLRCAERILPYMEHGDIFGLGDWCITGKLPKTMLPLLYETIETVVPFLGREGVQRVHIWGVCFSKALAALLWWCDQYGITVSTDSASPCIRPAQGKWGYAEWTNKTYVRPEPDIRGFERARHVAATRSWLASFRTTVWYEQFDRRQQETGA